MKVVKFLIRVFVLAVTVAAFFGVPFCWISVKAQGLFWGVLATLAFGRFFCDAICPLGILQGFINFVFHPRTQVRRVCTRLPQSRAQIVVRWLVVMAAVLAVVEVGLGAVTMVLPISIFGKALTLWWPGVAVFVLVMVLAAFGQGRIWCNWVCPLGTIYALLAKVSVFRNRLGEGCGNCRKCFAQEAKGKPSVAGGCERREVLKGLATLAVAEKLTDGGFAPISLPGVPKRARGVLPPGAGDAHDFALKCVGCQLCVANCPGKCLAPSMDLATFGQPTMDFRHGHCIASCVKCGEVCPELAIRPLVAEERANVHMGRAVWQKEPCLRTKGEVCEACVRKCPVKAIHLVGGVPVVDQTNCIGCGACEHVCPARPLPAIRVEGFAVQRIVSPMSEEDLVAEMRALVAGGKSCVIAKDGVIVQQLEGRGLSPLLAAFDADRKFVSQALVHDRVVGRAAAAIYALGAARQVIADVMSEDAAAFLKARGIACVSAKSVKEIRNRAGDGSCPLESAVKGLDDPKKMVEVLRATLGKLKKGGV